MPRQLSLRKNKIPPPTLILSPLIGAQTSGTRGGAGELNLNLQVSPLDQEKHMLADPRNRRESSSAEDAEEHSMNEHSPSLSKEERRVVLLFFFFPRQCGMLINPDSDARNLFTPCPVISLRFPCKIPVCFFFREGYEGEVPQGEFRASSKRGVIDSLSSEPETLANQVFRYREVRNLSPPPSPLLNRAVFDPNSRSPAASWEPITPGK